MKPLALIPRVARRCLAAALSALALQACLPSLETIEPTEPMDSNVVSELGMDPDAAGGSGGQGPSNGEPPLGEVPGLVTPPGGDEPPGDAELDPPPPLPSTLLLEAVTPAALVDVPVDAPLRITFSEPLDPAASSFTLQLLRAVGTPVAGQSVVQDDAIAFQPAQGLTLANSYTLILEGSVRSASGAEWSGREEASFETRDGTWIAPQLLSTSGSRPRIGLDEAGNALAIWNELDSSLSGQARLAMAQYTLSGGWQPLPVMTAGCGPECTPKFVAGGSNGQFQFAWGGPGSLNWQVYHRDVGFEEAQSESVRGGTADAVGVIVGAQPWIALHLAQGISVSFQGELGSAPESYFSDSGLGRAGPVLVVDRAQRARVFWAEGANLLQLGPGAGALPAVLTTWSANDTIASLTGASVPSGEALLGWETLSTSSVDGSVLRSTVGFVSVAADGAILSNDGPPLPEAGLGNRTRPATSLNEDGHALIGWLRTDGDPSDPLAASDVWLAYRAGSSRTWSEAVPLSLERAGIAHAPAVGIDISGNGHGIWVETDEAGSGQLYGARLSAGRLSGSRFPISRDTVVTPSPNRNELSGDDNTQLAVDAAGRALALWVSASGEIWSARFE